MSFVPTLTTERYAGYSYKPARATVACAGRLQRKSVDEQKLTVQSVLTYPVHDLAGDLVQPAGLDFSRFAADPRIDCEHSLKPEFGNLVVAWCRKSLSKPGAPLDVQTLPLEVDGTIHRLPVGTSHFDPHSRASMQCFRLVAEDKLPGVSLEFLPLAGKRLGKSTLEPRDAYEFTRCAVIRYTHCAQPVNPGALTVTKSMDALLPVIQSGRLGSEPLDPALLGVLRKSLSTYRPRRTLVRVEKAMPDEMDDTDTLATDDTPETVYDEAAPEVTDPEPEPPATPTVQAHYDVAQMLIDICEHARDALKTSEHMKGKQYLLKLVDKVEALAEDAKANGDKIDGELSGGQEPTDDEPVGEEIETDDDGTLKAIRPVYKARLKRFTLAELKAAEQAAHDSAPSEDPVAKAAALKELAREQRLLQRDYTRYVG